jgi:adenylate cyclase
VVHGESSLQKNRYHLPTIRTLIVAHHELGHLERAQELFATLRQLQPAMTLANYLQTGAVSPTRQRTARVLADLGLH